MKLPTQHEFRLKAGELLTPAQWNAIIDVNIRGVVHGVAAAGQITSYVTTKHAVVGLSLASRSAATCPMARRRLAPTLLNRVSVGFIERQRASQAAEPTQLS